MSISPTPLTPPPLIDPFVPRHWGSSARFRRELRLLRLRAAADVAGRLAVDPVTLPHSGDRCHVLHPVDTDLLLDQAATDPEQHLPYWAEIWPSGVALADAIALEPHLLRGQRVLELGSGLGITAGAAVRAGAALTVADYSSTALLLCRLNALRNAGREPAALLLNWRDPSAELFALAGGGFPVVLAADVLYEARDVEPLLALVGRIVAPGGLLWLAEPGRPVAARFLEGAGAAGWLADVPPAQHAGPWPDPKDEGVVVHLHRLVRPPVG